jgi:undecaprenyl diphosphate synthase
VGEHDEIMDNGVRLTAIGNVGRLPEFVREPLDSLIAKSAANRGMNLCLALSYGGRDAIVAAARAAIRSGIAPEKLDEDNLATFLPTRSMPPLDLLIRTSGEQRISNFLLWEAAYAELYFTPTLWPDFRRQHLYEALDAYAARERRFGLTSDQLKAHAGR